MVRANWIRRFWIRRNTIVLILAFVCYVLFTLALKSWFYPGWTWKGFLGDVKSIAALSVFVSPFIVYVWKAYKGKTPKDSVVDALRRGVSLRFAIFASCLLLIAIFGLGVFLLVFGESDLSPELLEFVSEGNWKYAHDVLTRLQGEPLRLEVWESLETYVAVNEACETEQYTDSKRYHDYRDAAQDFLEKNQDTNDLNSLSFAEASKAIFLLEGHPQDVLDAASEELTRTLRKTRSREERVAMLVKLGDLKLVALDYADAGEYFQDASALPMTAAFRAFLTARIGTIQFAQGNIGEAIQTYRQAEMNYPDPLKYLFYSNFGYLLLQAHDYEQAETEIKRALNVRADDWISYLNLGLVYDAMQRYSDASQEYRMVIDHGGANNLAHREALILMGYSEELSRKSFETYVPFYLAAEGRAASPETINELRSNPAEMRLLYQNMADCLTNGETHGIESYIKWFQSRAKPH